MKAKTITNTDHKNDLPQRSIYEELLFIQKTLSVPKAQYNSFGQYKFRSCEDILEAVKKITSLPIIIRDEIVQIGDRFYVKSIASIMNLSGETMDCCAFARESESKKGMDVSQVTCAASSYARKYALCGLFAIDDTKDPDHLEGSENIQMLSSEQIETLHGMISSADLSITKFCRSFNIEAVSELPETKYKAAMDRLNKRIDAKLNRGVE